MLICSNHPIPTGKPQQCSMKLVNTRQGSQIPTHTPDQATKGNEQQ